MEDSVSARREDATPHSNTSSHPSWSSYRGRIAPTPSGHLHLGHAATFWKAHERAVQARGVAILRIEDLDPNRCKSDYADAAIEDLRWLGIEWQEGPFYQSQRRTLYLEAWRRLRDGGFIYPCVHSRRDVAQAAIAPHEEDPVFPVEWRAPVEEGRRFQDPEGPQLEISCSGSGSDRLSRWKLRPCQPDGAAGFR